MLAAITAGSFAVWMIPQNTQTKFVVSDPKTELDALIEQQQEIEGSVAEGYDRMFAGEITPDNYINIAEISSSQINSFILKIIESDIPQEWQSSYSSYLEFLRLYNSYLMETIVVANQLKDNPQADMEQTEKMLEMLKQGEELLQASYEARPS
jgi:hypothetical protein